LLSADGGGIALEAAGLLSVANRLLRVRWREELALAWRVRVMRTSNFRRDPAIFDKTKIRIGPELATHLSEPCIRLPWRHGLSCLSPRPLVGFGLRRGLRERLGGRRRFKLRQR
jgi:hypothetical protein